jgi:hypothetical protein
MDVTKVKAAIATALKELNSVTDAEFSARRLAGLRPLTLAANALQLADGHLTKAAKAGQPKVATEAAATTGKK